MVFHRAFIASVRVGLHLRDRKGGALLGRSPTFVISLHHSSRNYTNILWRLPPQQLIPTHSPSGEQVDADLFVQQVKNMHDVLRMTQLVDSIHEMRACPYYECMFTNDLFFQHYDMILPMPKFGREARSAEISETLRYMRGCGATGDFNHVLQDVKGGAASGGDFLSTSHGVLMGYGTPRTNRLCMMALTGNSAPSEAVASQVRALSVEPVKMAPDSPPLTEILAFAGMRTLLVSDTAHGHRAAEQAVKLMPKVSWQTLKIEPGCSVLSHLCGANYVYDVLCDMDFPETMERIGESGLNPFPVEWSEPRKLGISMRSISLVLRFARGSMSGGGFADSKYHEASPFNYHGRDVSKNARLFQNGRRRHGDQGAPLTAQMQAGELEDPVYQQPPRYAPPMHMRGALQRK